MRLDLNRVTVHHGDSREVLRAYPDAHFDSVVCDPPYGLSFMGKAWDYDVPSVELWREVFRVLKPGGHLLAFFGTRTYHRGACAIEDAGFEVRDMVAWAYGCGFPKSHDVSKGIDKAAGASPIPTGEFKRASIQRNGDGEDWKAGAFASHPEHTKKVAITAPATDAARAWSGWGTALKPALEPVVMARKPLVGTVAQNVLTHGTGALNIDACRVEADESTRRFNRAEMGYGGGNLPMAYETGSDLGRWPANLIHDGSEEVGASLADAARFFYSAKASEADRAGSKHPTVKPVALMAYLCRLVTPPGGLVLDPFAGSGTTGQAAVQEGFRAVLIEREAEYVADIQRRVSACQAIGPLFGDA